MASLKIYSKEQTDALLQDKADMSDLPTSEQLVPSTSGASQGDVLTVSANGTVWASPTSATAFEVIPITNVNILMRMINEAKIGDQFMGYSLSTNTSNINNFLVTLTRNDSASNRYWFGVCTFIKLNNTQYNYQSLNWIRFQIIENQPYLDASVRTSYTASTQITIATPTLPFNGFSSLNWIHYS